MITVLPGGGGGYAQMIKILHRGEGSLRTSKSDYVICARPLISVIPTKCAFIGSPVGIALKCSCSIYYIHMCLSQLL